MRLFRRDDGSYVNLDLYWRFFVARSPKGHMKFAIQAELPDTMGDGDFQWGLFDTREDAEYALTEFAIREGGA